MKTANQWFGEYAESHQNETNTKIHFICVPLIYFSIIGALMSIDSSFLSALLPFQLPIFANWAFILVLPALFFYARLGFRYFLEMASFTLFCLVGNYFLAQFLPLFYTSVAIFVLAWIGQFYGHKVEGKKPSFFKDLQFLLIGPIWVIEKMMGRKA